MDFVFLVMYASWSCCQHCNNYHFNDKYFKEKVYNNPSASLAHVRQVPSDPLEHAHGSVGISSRWWYRPGMYKPEAWCQGCCRFPDDFDERMAASRTKRSKVDPTQELYVIPRIWPIEKTFPTSSN